MGWGAAQAYYEENSAWLDSVEDAYEALYGKEEPDKPRIKLKRRCPICNKRLKSPRGVKDHLRDYHKETGQEYGF